MIDIGGKYFMVILDQIVEFEVERKEGKDFFVYNKEFGYYSVSEDQLFKDRQSAFDASYKIIKDFCTNGINELETRIKKIQSQPEFKKYISKQRIKKLNK